MIIPTTRPSFRMVVLVFSMMIKTSIWGQINLPIIQKIEDKQQQLGANFQVVINPMIEDSLGYIWIGTKKGLCKYSGSSIQCFEHQKSDTTSLSGNDIENLFMDSQHHIWVCIKNKGIDIFNIRGQKINQFKKNKQDSNSLLSNRVWGIFEDHDGYIWVSYFSGRLSRYDIKTNKFDHFSIDSKTFLQKYRPKTVVHSIAHRKEKNTFWLSTTRGLVKFNTRTQDYKSYLFYSNPKSKIPQSNYNWSNLESLWNRSMIQDEEGILWLGNFGGFVRFDPQDESYRVFFDESTPILKNIVGIHNYDKDHLLLSLSEGLVLFSKKDFTYFALDKKNKNNKYYLHSRFYYSQNGCLYFINANGKNGGIYKSCEQYQYVHDHTTNHSVGSILTTENYLHYYSPQSRITSEHLITGLKTSFPLSINRTKTISSLFPTGADSLLIADQLHIYDYHPTKKPTIISELIIKNAYRYESILKDSKGNVWTGRQRDGIYKYDQKSQKIIHYNQSSKPNLVYQDNIISLMEDRDGDIWIATEQGWTIYDPLTNTTRNYLSDDISIQFNTELQVITDFVQTNDGHVWISTAANGLIEWDKVNEQILSTFSESDSLRSNNINEMILDNDNNIWAVSNDALLRINTKTKVVISFGKEVGLSHKMFCLAKHPQKEIIFIGHNNGYYKVNITSLLEQKPIEAKATILGFNIHSKNMDSLLHTKNPIRLTHNRNFISIDFGSLNYYNPQNEVYQYKLESLDKKWINANGKRTAFYTDLNPGKYKFLVRVKTTSDWSKSAGQKIIISPIWYRTWWFNILSLFLFAETMYLIARIYNRNKQQKIETEKRFAELETIIMKSQMNPHFIFNSLNSIRYLFMKDEKNKGIKYITKFAKLLRSTLKYGDQTLVQLSEEIEFTELFISLEQLRFDDKFNFSSSYPKDNLWQTIKIPPFVIQPIVENAFWHGLMPSEQINKHLELNIQHKENHYLIEIEDNGVGIHNDIDTTDNVVGKNKSYGLKMIKERFNLIQKTQGLIYHIKTNPSRKFKSGTLVQIKIFY